MLFRYVRNRNNAAAILAAFYSNGLGFDNYAKSVQSGINLRGKTFLVTGSTSGIGLTTAELLAQTGATVLVHGRVLARVKKLIKNLRLQYGNHKIFGYCQDLSTAAGVQQLADHISKDLDTHFDSKLHCLINNAGVFLEDKEVTPDGLEMTWAVNTAAPFLLTARLLPYIQHRIINSTSISLANEIDLSKTVADSPYETSGHSVYGNSKLGLNMWTYLLASKLQEVNSTITANVVDPGTVNTKLLYAGWGDVAYVALPAHEAEDVFWAATSAALDDITGTFFCNKRKITASPVSRDRALQEKVWRLLEEQTGAVFDFSKIHKTNSKYSENVH